MISNLPKINGISPQKVILQVYSLTALFLGVEVLQRSLTHSPALLQLAFHRSKAKVLPVRIRTQVRRSVILRSTTRAASTVLKLIN